MKPRVLRIIFAALLLSVVGTWAEAAPDEPAARLTEKVVLRPEGGAKRGLPDSWRRVDRLAFSPDGKILAFTEGYSGTVHLWDVANGKEAAVFESILLGLVFSPDGKTLATCGDRKIMLWDVASRKKTATLEGDDAFDNVAFSLDGKTLAAVGKTRDAVFPKKWLTLWDVEKKKELKRRQIGSDRDVVVLYVSMKRPLLGLRQKGEKPGYISYTLIDPFTGGKVFTGMMDRFHISFLALDPTEKLLAATGPDQVIRLWDRRTGLIIADFKHPPTVGLCLGFSPDGEILACGHMNGFHLFKVPDGKILAAEKKRRTVCLAFSPDGRLLAAGDDTGTITLWSVPAAWRKKK